MLKIRLQRVGRKNDPSFRIVVTNSQRGPKSNDYVELLGSYNPRQKTITVKGDRVKHWLSVGAQASNTVHNLLIKEKVIEGKKINALSKKTPIAKEEEVKEEAPKEEVAEETPEEDAPVEETPKEEDKKEEVAEEVKKEVKEEEKKEA